jgi:hypothetical protein
MLEVANPFSEEKPDHRALWEMLMLRDIRAFAARDWSQVDEDFAADVFFGIHANGSLIPGRWTLSYPRLEHYKREWLRQAEESAVKQYVVPLEQALHEVSCLHRVVIQEGTACVWKRFDGVLRDTGGAAETLSWQTVYFSQKRGSAWKIVGFIGYLPLTEQDLDVPGAMPAPGGNRPASAEG